MLAQCSAIVRKRKLLGTTGKGVRNKAQNITNCINLKFFHILHTEQFWCPTAEEYGRNGEGTVEGDQKNQIHRGGFLERKSQIDVDYSA